MASEQAGCWGSRPYVQVETVSPIQAGGPNHLYKQKPGGFY